MHGLPTELVKLCHLASMSECGDHSWSGPALGGWAALWRPLIRRWDDWRGLAQGPGDYALGEKSGIGACKA